MRRRILAVAVTVLIVAIASAGCLGTSDPAQDASDETDASGSSEDATRDPTGPNGSAMGPEVTANATEPRHVRYEGCTSTQAIFVAPGTVAPATPDGFTPAAPGYPGLAGSAATIVVDGHVCDNATAGSRTLEDVRELHVSVLVDPPDRYESDDVGSYAVEIGSVVADEDLHDIYRSWNLTDAELGQIQATITRAASAAEQGQLTADADDTALRLLTATEGQGGPLDSYRARIFATEGGEVTSVVDIHVADGNRTTGTARLAVTDAPTAAASPPTLVAMNGLGTGLASHYSVDRTWTWRDPGEFG